MNQQREREQISDRLAKERRWAWLLDDLIRIPGTKLGIGLDGLIGFFFPGVGDALTGSGALAMVYRAIKMGAPRSVIIKMLLNIGVDTLVGSLPIVGDFFDVIFRANRRNLHLLEKMQDGGFEARQTDKWDYVFVGLAIFLAVLGVVLPLLFIGWAADSWFSSR